MAAPVEHAAVHRSYVFMLDGCVVARHSLVDLAWLSPQKPGARPASTARRLNPSITVKWVREHGPNLPPVFEGLHKAGLAEE